MAAPVQYGPRITAIILYLYVGQLLSKKRIAQALAELFGTRVGEGTVATMTKRAADRLDEFLDLVKDLIGEAEVAGFDETGLRVAGALHWVHCARTGKYRLITCHPKRGREGIDAWAPDDTYVDVEHQLCCAHALHELAGVAEATAGQAGLVLGYPGGRRAHRHADWSPTRSLQPATPSTPTPSTSRFGSTGQPYRSASPPPRPAQIL